MCQEYSVIACKHMCSQVQLVIFERNVENILHVKCSSKWVLDIDITLCSKHRFYMWKLFWIIFYGLIKCETH